ncbi:MAG TPA: protease complex subunit PrcB family protein [Gemmatimonadota bacterium]|nr:protease complex subunit PrcB family protein [Gemmatimonadota bacterium]
MSLRAAVLLPAAGASLAALLACANGPPPRMEGPTPHAGEGESLAIDPLYENLYSGIEEPRRALIRSEAEWRDIWIELTGAQEPAVEPPAVDFQRRAVVVAAMGSRPTGGYTIRVASARMAGDRLAVEVVETSPGPTCLLTQAFTAPAIAVAVEGPPAEVAFVDREETHSCE